MQVTCNFKQMLFSPMHLMFCAQKNVIKAKRVLGKTDLCQKSSRHYKIQFPDFYYSVSDDGWFCENCASFASSTRDKRAFTDKPGGIGEHTSHEAALPLGSARHKQSILSKQVLLFESFILLRRCT